MMPPDLQISLTEHSPLASFAYDLRTNKLVYVNAAFRNLFRTGRGDVQPESVIKYIPEKDLIYLKKAYKLFRKGKYKKNVSFRIVFADRDEKWIELIPGRDYEEDSLIPVYAKDITDETNNIESIRKYANKKNSILTILAHDLTGPLGIAQSAISVLGKKVEEAYLKKLIENIAKSNAQALGLIHDLVQRELLETSSVVLYKKRVNVVKKLEEMIGEFKSSQDISNRTFHFEASGEDILLDLDEPKFIQIINNLMSNALKFTHTDGIIKISIREQEDTVLFSFSDNGIGIPREFHHSVFDKFTAARRNGLNGEPTIGLGLAIVKMIVEWHNGRIWFESRVNEGTTFYFELPYHSQD